MILQSLYAYYQILLKDPESGISRPGFSSAQVSHALNLSIQGELQDIIPLYVPVQRGKKTYEEPVRKNVPEQVKRTVNIAPNFMCDNAVSVLGISDKEAKDPEYALLRWQAFRDFNLQLLEGYDSPMARAVTVFLREYDPRQLDRYPVIQEHLEELKQARNLIFMVEGTEALSDEQILRAWEAYQFGKGAMKMQCLVTGEVSPIARLHPSIKGIPGANTTGSSLVGFNDRAYESYNRIKQQGLNSPTSQEVASGYGVALNYLLSTSNPNPKIKIGDTTVVYWAESEDKRYASEFYEFINPQYLNQQSTEDQATSRSEIQKKMSVLSKSIEAAKPIDMTGVFEGLNPQTHFFVLGLAPNSARISVRFFIAEPFKNFANNIMQHYQDLSIDKQFAWQPTYISPVKILEECVSPKVAHREDEVAASWSLEGGALLRAVLTGQPYPAGLYVGMINRIRHDSDEANNKGGKNSTKINYVRAAFIKAYLLRKYRRQLINPYQEALQMSLNEEYSNPAYVLGRLFAWLEKAQVDSSGQNINATIKDRYFTSACATPASVFPVLLRLSQHWTSKADYGDFDDRKIGELLNKLEAQPLPSHLNLDEQGIFVLGYYHQRARIFEKSDQKIKINENDQETEN